MLGELAQKSGAGTPPDTIFWGTERNFAAQLLHCRASHPRHPQGMWRRHLGLLEPSRLLGNLGHSGNIHILNISMVEWKYWFEHWQFWILIALWQGVPQERMCVVQEYWWQVQVPMSRVFTTPQESFTTNCFSILNIFPDNNNKHLLWIPRPIALSCQGLCQRLHAEAGEEHQPQHGGKLLPIHPLFCQIFFSTKFWRPLWKAKVVW